MFNSAWSGTLSQKYLVGLQLLVGSSLDQPIWHLLSSSLRCRCCHALLFSPAEAQADAAAATAEREREREEREEAIFNVAIVCNLSKN